MPPLLPRARHLLAAAALLLVFTHAGPGQARQTPAKAGTTALVGGTLIDGFGGPPVRNSVILLEGERITAVGQVGSLAVPAGAEVISTEGMSVLPGLWDMHVHLMINGHADYAHWDRTYPPLFESVIMPASAHQLLMAGVTSARDLGAPLEPSISVRDRIKPWRDSRPHALRLGSLHPEDPLPRNGAVPVGRRRPGRRAREGEEAG